MVREGERRNAEGVRRGVQGPKSRVLIGAVPRGLGAIRGAVSSVHILVVRYRSRTAESIRRQVDG
jgi:hypothetical protein